MSLIRWLSIVQHPKQLHIACASGLLCCGAVLLLLQTVTRAGSWPLIPSQGLVSSLQCTTNPQTLLGGWQHCRRCSHAQREWRDCWVVLYWCVFGGGGGGYPQPLSISRQPKCNISVRVLPAWHPHVLYLINNECTACYQPLIWLLTCMALSPASCLCCPQVFHSRP